MVDLLTQRSKRRKMERGRIIRLLQAHSMIQGKKSLRVDVRLRNGNVNYYFAERRTELESVLRS